MDDKDATIMRQKEQILILKDEVRRERETADQWREFSERLSHKMKTMRAEQVAATAGRMK
jgi:hypothetical protein